MSLNAKHITQLFNMAPDKINKGFCWLWALAASEMFGAALYGIPSHAFVKFNNKFYDADCPNGEIDWRDLPACSPRDYADNPIEFTKLSFINCWIGSK